MKNINSVRDGKIVAFIDATMYSKEVIFKCLYWFGDKFHINIEQEEGIAYYITLNPLTNANIKVDDLDNYLQKLERDIIDFHLRDIINKETRHIRDLLVAKAFSNGEFDESPPGEVSDPVGFDPSLLTS